MAMKACYKEPMLGVSPVPRINKAALIREKVAGSICRCFLSVNPAALCAKINVTDRKLAIKIPFPDKSHGHRRYKPLKQSLNKWNRWNNGVCDRNHGLKQSGSDQRKMTLFLLPKPLCQSIALVSIRTCHALISASQFSIDRLIRGPST